MKYIILLLICLLLLAPKVVAQSEEDLDKQINELQLKVSQLQTKSKTLTDQITYFDNQISLQSLKINQSHSLIENLTTKVVQLESKLQKRSEVLEEQIRQTYKLSHSKPLELLFSQEQFSEIVSKYKYVQVVQANSRKFLYDTQKVQSNYVNQKEVIEAAKKKLESQKASLAKIRKDRDVLLSQTKNDESNYQKLLTEAISQRDAFKSFTHASGGNMLPPQPSPDGWFMSQRDGRWGGQCIGTTCSKNPSLVWEVGCLITSVAMMQKKNGVDINPGMLARKSEYFFEDLMLVPWPAQNGYKWINYGASWNVVDKEISAGRPVVIQIKASSSPSGRHFLVIKSKSDSGYMMNDPWEGYNLKYTDFYRSGNLVSVATYVKS